MADLRARLAAIPGAWGSDSYLRAEQARKLRSKRSTLECREEELSASSKAMLLKPAELLEPGVQREHVESNNRQVRRIRAELAKVEAELDDLQSG